MRAGVAMMANFTHIDLFSGIGGFALAARWAGFQTVAFVEIDEYCQRVIKKNFGVIPHDDIKTFDGTRYRGAALLTGGFPCQPFSQAGKRRGKEDDRYLWPEMHRVIAECKPAWVVAENVAGIVNMELDSVLSDLEGEGYECQAFIIPAVAVDAKHRRDRVWIVAHHDSYDSRASWQSEVEGRAAGLSINASEPTIVAHLADAASEGRGSTGSTSETIRESRAVQRFAGCGGGQWSEWIPESAVGRVANGIPRRVDRLKGLGNAIVPQVAYEILKAIAKIETGV